MTRGATYNAEFEAVYQGLFITAYGIACRMLQDRTEAEDVASEAIARALHKWSRVRSMASPTPWICRVAYNLSIDVLRRQPRTVTIEPDGSSELDSALTRLDVQEMLRRLPRRQRDVIALRYLAGLSEEEIASALGISNGSVKKHASRALERLRRNNLEGAASYAAC